ncbi:A24 family peptidase [Acidiphilium iwatense]|uniref:A24 family peptidase n=1 Tax=Acidiphilium iwatense TaxID=768198 RepID=A0ABS9DSS6_9PROT|nr:A24 family peptidase [Acidiphilium iwatense]
MLAIELVSALLGAVSAWLYPSPWPASAAALLGWGLLALAWIDAKYFFLPDVITVPLLLLGLAATWQLEPADFTGHLIGALSGYLVIAGVNSLYKSVRHRDGIGHGDAKLMALAGAWVGWQPLPWIVLSGAILGIASAITARFLRHQDLTPTTRLAFGACLAPAVFAAYLLKSSALAIGL